VSSYTINFALMVPSEWLIKYIITYSKQIENEILCKSPTALAPNSCNLSAKSNLSGSPRAACGWEIYVLIIYVCESERARPARIAHRAGASCFTRGKVNDWESGAGNKL
jgi:hypothetical protein